ncbi:hypothetical protein [Methylobacterium sp. J-070]|uniref:hypothetical protein n=1 Tax=Methylobacterium sp. J-070 TaxID=2836650 RepID=UPI001FBAB886|nr:hypothetical protein [Methylobacterium sp. J-070]MCJ2051252.1 hypothetical protein [Methylobacterium sp. J-070]
MSNLTSTLTLQLKDDGLAAKAKADAEALKRLGASGEDLKKLGTAGAAALKQLDALAGKGARIDAFRANSKALKEQGAALRQARATAAKEAAALARVQATGEARAIRTAEKAHAAAMKRQAALQDAFVDRGRAVRMARNELLSSGVGRAGRGLALGAAEKALAAETEAANAHLREQIALLGRVSGAEHKAATAAKTHALAEKMATADSRRQAAAAANARLKAGMGGVGGLGAAARAGAEAAAAAHSARRGGHGDRDAWVKHHGVVGTVAAGAAGYASAHGILGGIEHGVKTGANLQHEQVALMNAGRTPEELREIAAASQHTTAAVPTASYEENLKVVNETTSAFGSLHHAIEHLTFMQKAASVVHAAAGDKVQDDAGEMGNKMARFAEERGTAGNGENFERETGKLVRAMVFTRGNFNPTEMLNFAQQAKSSLQGYNERFLTGIMPSLVGTSGGDRAGTAANAFNSVIDGKVNDMKQAEEWKRLGLLDPKQAIMKAGHAVGWRTGAIKNTALAHADPLQWMEDDVLPALAKHGGKDGKGINVDDQEQLKQALATLFRNQNANFFANELAQLKMRQRLHKDEGLMTGVGSMDEIYARNLAQDPQVSGTALKASLENLTSAATSPGMAVAATAITGLATALNSLAAVASDHPKLAMTAGAVAAGGALAGAGALSYGIATGFGLGSSAVALDGSAAALTAAAAELGGAGVLGKIPGGGPGTVAGRLGALGFIGTAGLGIGAIAAGVGFVDATLPNANRMNGNGKLFRKPGGIESYPAGWGPGGGVDVGGGIGASGGTFSTHRPKTWGETIFGSTRASTKDPTTMNLPVPAGMGGPKVEVSGADTAKEKLEEVKAKGDELSKLTIAPAVTIAGAGTAIQQLETIIRLSSQANGAIASVNGGMLRARSSASFSDGVTPGAGAE